jgi:predicted nucleotidyltransferase
MSSASKSSRKGQRGRATESAKKTSPRTSASSKRSIASRPAAVALLADFAAAMRRRRLDWYVFGAQAAVAYGRPRMTADVDVTVAIEQLGTLTLVDELSRAGFDLRVALGEDFLRDARLLPLVHRSTAMPVDVVLAGSSLHLEFLARRRLVDVGGVRVPMISPEDLIVTKVLAGRPKDMEDVRGVLLEQPRLDLERVRELLGELEVALGDDQLIRRFERLIRRPRVTRARAK